MIITRSFFLLILAGVILMIITAFYNQVDEGGTPTPLPVPIIPTYPPSEVTLPVVIDLMQADENCLLPCFWGFHLGQNTTQETTAFVIDAFHERPYVSIYDDDKEIIDKLDPSDRGMDFYATFLPLSSDGGSLQAIFRSIDNILARIDVHLYKAASWLEANPFTLSKILAVYGEPTDIYLRYSGAPAIGYVLAVVYEDQGFIIEYGFGNDLASNERLMSERITKEGRLLICDEDPAYDSIDLTLQVDGNPTPLINALQPSLDDSSVFRPFWEIEDMTGLSVEEFTEAFAGHPDACIEAFSLSELQTQGYG